MRITGIRERSSSLIRQLLEIWGASVRATHLFLSDDEIETIKTYIPQTLAKIPRLVIVENDDGPPVAFMKMDDQKLEMLFVSGEERRNGLGKQLIRYGIEAYSVNELAVNEQNPPARGFYEHMGFHVYHRTEFDEQESPYPLLYMRYGRR